VSHLTGLIGDWIWAVFAPHPSDVCAKKANLFPTAVVHFGSEERRDCYLKPDLLESTVTPSTADLLVARYLSKTIAPSPSVSTTPPMTGLEEAEERMAMEHPEPARIPEGPRQPVRQAASGKVPKWLKLPAGKR
uniref:Uncharacterized protein n=1 Tax=Sphenodon punctatus TaxID=8508 RepID=A0A8D0GRJ3_SPHPU